MHGTRDWQHGVHSFLSHCSRRLSPVSLVRLLSVLITSVIVVWYVAVRRSFRVQRWLSQVPRKYTRMFQCVQELHALTVLIVQTRFTLRLKLRNGKNEYCSVRAGETIRIERRWTVPRDISIIWYAHVVEAHLATGSCFRVSHCQRIYQVIDIIVRLMTYLKHASSCFYLFA